MKKSIFFILITLVIFSCKKFEELRKDKQEDNYRIKEIINYYGDTDLKSQFHYNNEKLTRWDLMLKDENDIEAQVEIKYEGNIASFVSKEKTDNNEWEEDIKIDFKIINGLTVETIRYDKSENNFWVQESKETIEYSNGNVISSHYYDLKNQNPEPIYKTILFYDNDKLNEMISYYNISDTWQETQMVTFSYLKNKKDGYITYQKIDDNWGKRTKVEYDFMGEIISVKKVYKWNDDENEWDLDDFQTYEYDSNNNLIRRVFNDGDKEIMIYEPGKGNILNFTYFSENIRGEPTIKSANKFNTNFSILKHILLNQ